MERAQVSLGNGEFDRVSVRESKPDADEAGAVVADGAALLDDLGGDVGGAEAVEGAVAYVEGVLPSRHGVHGTAPIGRGHHGSVPVMRVTSRYMTWSIPPASWSTALRQARTVGRSGRVPAVTGSVAGRRKFW